MVLFFDLDGTLINTARLKQYLVDFCVRRGLTEAAAKACYEKSRDNGAEVTFTVPCFLESLGELYPEKSWSSSKELKAELAVHVELMPGAIELIQQLSQESLYLLSLGQPEWQDWKLKCVALETVFSPTRRLYTQTPQVGKVEVVEAMFGRGLKLFFNDHLEECQQFLAKWKNSIVFLITENAPQELMKAYPSQLFVGKSLLELKGKYDSFMALHSQQNLTESL